MIMDAKKLLFFFYTLFFCFTLYSQNGISFTEVNLTNENLAKDFRKYQILKINDSTSLITDGAAFEINYVDTYQFTLKENRFVADDFKLALKSEEGVAYKKLDELGFDGKYFRNANGSIGNQIALSLFENQYTVYIKKADKEIYIEPLVKYDKTAASNYYVYYETSDIIDQLTGECPVKDDDKADLEGIKNYRIQPMDSWKTVELNFCVDYSMYITYNSINAVINRTLEVLNLSQLNYSISNGLAYDVNFKIKRYFLITCFNCNYWPTTGNIYENSNGFFYNYRSMFDYASDIIVFWQNIHAGTSNIAGLAAVITDNNCSSVPLLTRRQSVIKNYINDLNFTKLTLSHEMGHNFGSSHVGHYNNIMGAGSYYGNLWLPETISLINGRLATSNCFYDCAVDSCNNKKVENLVLNVDSTNKIINASWQPENGIQYKTRLYNFTTDIWSAYSLLNASTSSIAYNYNNDTTNCRSKYKFEIVPVCSDFDGFSQILLFTVPTVVSPGLNFQSIVQDEVLCSTLEYTFSVSAANPGTTPVYQWKINTINVGSNSPTFTTSSLQNNDVLSCEITSNEPCLTSQTATVTKMVTVIPQPCSLSGEEFEVEAIQYYPNPVKNYFTIKSTSAIKNVIIYNMLGQKIIDKQINSTETELDLSMLSNALYFVKIESDNATKTIKIIVKK